MKNYWFILVVSLLILGCSNQSELENIFKCKSRSTLSSKTITDFNKNFKIDIPINWKTNLYYDEFQSEIFTADTTKQLTETYILTTSFKYGNLQFNTDFYTKNDSIFKNLSLEKLNSGTIQFKGEPGYWIVVKGKKNGFSYQQFNLYILLSENTYFNATTEIYGDERIEARICESLAILSQIEFLQ